VADSILFLSYAVKSISSKEEREVAQFITKIKKPACVMKPIAKDQSNGNINKAHCFNGSCYCTD
jgi:hypothetical protein